MKEHSTNPSMRGVSEARIAARVVSRGIAVGRAVCLYGQKRQFFRIAISPESISAELARLDAAVEVSTRQLESLLTASKLSDSVTEILEVHLIFIRESSLIENFKQTVINECVNAEWAVKLVSDDHISRYRAIKDDHLREKAVDLEDVTARILNALAGDESVQHLPADAVLVASEIRPSTMLEFLHTRPAALVTEHGGWTSHAFIMAREMGIPALAGVRNVLRRVKTGYLVGVDAIDGEVIVRPSDRTQVELAAKLRSIHHEPQGSAGPTGDTATMDGRTIQIAANVDKPEACRRAMEIGVSGIGLLRSEYLFEHMNGLPNEETQTAAYCEVAKIAGNAGVRIRTFDLGIEQTSVRADLREKNPALGLRAIRLSLEQEGQFRVQLRSILRASSQGKVQIVLPLVSGVEEIKRSLTIVRDEWSTLEKIGIPCGQPELGAMIELPSAVFSIREILRYVDFVCLGTNDLVQYLVGVDRDNESVADWYQTLHPAVLRAIKTVLDAADEAKIPAVMCGEMAGSTFYSPLLIGLGACNFSMNLQSIQSVRKLISGINYTATLELVELISRAETASEIQEILLGFYRERWSHLFPQEILAENVVKQNKNITKN